MKEDLYNINLKLLALSDVYQSYLMIFDQINGTNLIYDYIKLYGRIYDLIYEAKDGTETSISS